jgi:hypothetical protein
MYHDLPNGFSGMEADGISSGSLPMDHFIELKTPRFRLVVRSLEKR